MSTYHAEVQTYGMMVVRTDPPPETIVYTLAGMHNVPGYGLVEQITEALVDAGWEPVNNDWQPANGMIMKVTVKRIEEDGRACGCPPGEHDTLTEWDKECRDHGFPYCDSCGHAAVWSEMDGWHHSVAEHHFGLPRRLEAEYGIPDPGHNITTKAWAMERYGHE